MRIYPKRSLAAMVRRLRPHLWTAHPLESFRHDELITLIIEAEFPGICVWHDQPKVDGHKCDRCLNPHRGDPSMDPAIRHEEIRDGRTYYSAHDATGVITQRCPNCP